VTAELDALSQDVECDPSLNMPSDDESTPRKRGRPDPILKDRLTPVNITGSPSTPLPPSTANADESIRRSARKRERPMDIMMSPSKRRAYVFLMLFVFCIYSFEGKLLRYSHQ